MLPTGAQLPSVAGLGDSCDLRQRADAAGKSATAGAGVDSLPTAMRRFDVAALLRMAVTLRELGGLPFGHGPYRRSRGRGDGHRRPVTSLLRWAFIRTTPSADTSTAVAEVVHQAAGERAGPLRVLELGAGVGGTAATVLTSLAARKVDYLFTDVSRFFLNTGRKRFGEHPGLRYALVDINGELPGQGLLAGKADVVIATNVVHNAHHVGRVMANLRRLLAPDGLLVMTELCREYYQFVISIKFLVSPQHGQPVADSTDVRVEGDLPYPDDEPLGGARPAPVRRHAHDFRSEQLVATCAGTLRENPNHAGRSDAVHGEIWTRGGTMPSGRSVESGRSVR